MKPRPPSPDADPALSRLLRQWAPDLSVPPGFHQAVLRKTRSAHAAPAPALPSFRQLLATLLQTRLAPAYFLLLLLAGAGAGAWKGQSSAHALGTTLQHRYVQSIDPFAASVRPAHRHLR